MHSAQYVAEIREAQATADGWRQFEGTGRACVVCPCGTTTGFVDKKDALQAYKDHGAGKPLAELALWGHKDTPTGPARNAYYQGDHRVSVVPGSVEGERAMRNLFRKITRG